MTRFNELARIEAAIEHRNEPELRWAESYCRMRLSIVSRKEHAKYWRNLERKVANVLRELAEAAGDSR
ncbi:MAG TPA: hypothetical protein VD837_07495 [Terriglobales bacterium]|nr:hypothetical protein [Terriglobales bacterium]